MKFVRAFLGIAVLSVGLCFAAENLHKGRLIHLWLEELLDDKQEKRESAERELKNMGTNALPALYSYITSFGSAFSSHDSSIVYRSFQLLGSTAKPAIPRLLQLADDPNYSKDACNALHLIGRETIPIFVSRLTNSNPNISDSALQNLIWFALETNYVADLQIALPAIRKLISENATRTHNAMTALRVISTNGNQYVSDLLSYLRSNARDTRILAATQLRMYGTNAHAAIPALLQAYDDKDQQVRNEVALAIQAIDPKETKRAAVKVPVYE
jgi:HEAT repeat protein